MRLWSVHPRYLDAQGLVALWREGLLAKKVLEGKTTGYRHHPQLTRFRAYSRPTAAITVYLHAVCDEADARGYKFDRTKLGRIRPIGKKISVHSKQVSYEWRHLLRKLKRRNPILFKKFKNLRLPKVHDLFKKIPGPIESWEVLERASKSWHKKK